MESPGLNKQAAKSYARRHFNFVSSSYYNFRLLSGANDGINIFLQRLMYTLDNIFFSKMFCDPFGGQGK